MQPKVDQFMHETERTCLSAKIYAFLVTNLTGFWSMSFQNPLASRRGECTKMHNLTSQNGTYSSAHHTEREIASARHGRVSALEAHPGRQQGKYGKSAANQEYVRRATA
jgi:hypothetical protein